MFYSIKQVIFSLIFNSTLLIMLIIGIQNSGNKNKVNLIFNESVELPVSFIIGTAFISGSILGSLIEVGNILKKDKKVP